MLRNGLGYTKGLTVSLQSHSQDICNAYAEVVTVIESVIQNACYFVEYRKVPRISSPPSAPNSKKWLLFKRAHLRNLESLLKRIQCFRNKMVPVHDYEKRYAEAFAITMRTFKHEPFLLLGAEGGGGGGGGGGLFVVLDGNKLCGNKLGLGPRSTVVNIT